MLKIGVVTALMFAMVMACASAQATDHKNKEEKKTEQKKREEKKPDEKKPEPKKPEDKKPEPAKPEAKNLPAPGQPLHGYIRSGDCRSNCCNDAHITVNLDPRPCYTANGLNTFMAIFSRAAEKGVENATIRAMNAAKVCPDCDEQPSQQTEK